MTRYFLTRLSVEGFRGINNEGAALELTFKPDAVNSIFAANGSGKSSLYEALQFAFRGSIPRLSEMQASERPDDYLVNLFHTANESTIEITLTPDDGGPNTVVAVKRTATRSRQVSSPTGHPDPERLLESLGQEFALLDYGKFAKFISDTALDRGRSFSSLLGLSAYADFRRTLKAVEQTQTFKSDFDTPTLEAKKVQLGLNLDRISRQYSNRYREVTGEELTDLSLIEESAGDLVAALRGVPLLCKVLTDVQLEDIDFELLNSTILGAENGEDRQRLIQLTQENQAWSTGDANGQSVQENVARAKLKLTARQEALEGTSGPNMHALLEAAHAFFEAEAEWNMTQCPLCESTLVAPIDGHVTASLELFSAANKTKSELRDEVVNGPLAFRLAELETLPSILEDDEEPFGPMLRAHVDDGSLVDAQLDFALSHLQTLEERVEAKLGEIAEKIDDLEKSLPPSLVGLTTQVASVSSARDDLKTYRATKTEAVAVSAELATIARWKAFISNAHASFADAEAKLSKETLEGLRIDYQAMFRGIMSVGDVVPTLARSGTDEQLTVELSDFHGHHDVSARALLSESYRNALAISVFLSAAVKHGKAPRFVVLDDVTSSFDSGHQFRLMEQIRTQLQYPTNPDGLQFIMLSHDVTLEKYFDRLGDEPGWHHQKLQGWPPFTPVSAHGQNPDRLRAEADRFLRAGQIEQGAGLIRQYLEFTLQQIIRKVQIPVPIDIAVNDHMKMAGNCIDAIVSAVLLNQKAGVVSLDAQQIADLTARHAPSIVANWISHYGTSASAVFSPPSLLGVLADIGALRRCFQFDASGTGDWRFYKTLAKRI